MVIALEAEAANHSMNINCHLITGKTSHKDRQAILRKFQQDVDTTNTMNVVVSIATLIEVESINWFLLKQISMYLNNNCY
jgi:RecG-like helicase